MNDKQKILLLGVFLIISSSLIYQTAFGGSSTSSTKLEMFISPNTPEIISFTATGNPEPTIQFDNDDILTITFDKDTNRPIAGTKSEIDNVFEFRQSGGMISIGDDYVGTWIGPSVFQIRIVDSSNNVGPQLGQLTVKVKTSGNLRDITETSNASTSESPFLTGNFGARIGPAITSLTAQDLNPVEEGYSNGDTITVRFDVDTNGFTIFGTNSFNKATVDGLLEFKELGSVISIGEDYTGKWTSKRNLVITIIDNSTAKPPKVGLLTVKVKADAGPNGEGLRVALPEVSEASTSTSPIMVGSFGLQSGPKITSFTVKDPDGGDGVYGALDVFTLKFDKPTNQPFGPSLDRGKVDQLLTFSKKLAGPLGNYIGVWIDPITLQITVLDTTGNENPVIDDPSLGIQGTRATVKQSANLKVSPSIGNSEVSTSQSPPLKGDFGHKAGPTIDIFEAADPQISPIAGFSKGDTLTLTFSEDTNRPIASIKKEIDKKFEFWQGGEEISIGKDYVGTWISPSVFQIRIVNATIPDPPGIIPTKGQLTVKLKSNTNLKNAAGNSLDSVGESPPIIGDFGLKSGPLITSLVAADQAPISAGFSDQDTITVRFDVDTNGVQLFGTDLDKTEVDSLLSFTQDIGDSYSAQWINAKTLRITILDASTEQPPELGVLRAIVKQSAGNGVGLKVKSPDTSLASSSISPPLSGTFGQKDGPFIVSVTARDPFGQDGADAVYGPNDRIIIEFSEKTNQPKGPFLFKSEVDELFSFSEILGSEYTAEWITPQILEITIGEDITGAGSGLVDFPQEPVLQVTVKSSANLKDAGLTSFPSTSQSPPIQGNFGTKQGPAIDFIIAEDTPPVETGLSKDDIITVIFDQATNKKFDPDRDPGVPPLPFLKGEVDQLFTFSKSIGDNYTAKWIDPFTLKIAIVSAEGAEADVGDLTLEVTGDLKNSENTSFSSTDISPQLIGDFGKEAGPSIIALVADDPLKTPGFTNGDTISVIFSEKTNEKFGPDLDKGEVDKLLTFSQSIGDDYNAKWNNAENLVITISDSNEITEPPEVDQLQVIVKESADLRNEAEDSLPSISVSPLLSGSFGGFFEEISLCEGGDAFSTFPDGKTAEISFAGTDCGGFTFKGADEETSERIEFLGDFVTISPTGGVDCSEEPFCTISFVFREDDIPEDTEEPITENIKIFKDVDENGDIDQEDPDTSNEVFNGLPPGTPQTFVVPLDDNRFEASATTPSNSKFAIGGIKALALGALGPSVGPSPSVSSSTTSSSAGTGASGGAGGGGNAASLGEPNGLAGEIDLSQVKLYEATWDKCDKKILRVIAGPPGPGLSVKAVQAMGGIVAMSEAAEQPFTKATVYEIPIYEIETFIRVQVEGVIGREPSLAQRSLDLRECIGSIGGYSETEDIVTPPLGILAGSFPSTAALFEDGSMFDTRYNDIDFTVGYWISKGQITQMDVNEDSKSITFGFSDKIGGRLVLSLPRGMITADKDQFILINPETSQQISYDVIESGSQYVTLEMTLPEEMGSITVVGTNVVPEFGAITLVVLVLSIICIIVMPRIKQTQLVK